MFYDPKEAEGRVGWVQDMDKTQLSSEPLYR